MLVPLLFPPHIPNHFTIRPPPWPMIPDLKANVSVWLACIHKRMISISMHFSLKNDSFTLSSWVCDCGPSVSAWRCYSVGVGCSPHVMNFVQRSKCSYEGLSHLCSLRMLVTPFSCSCIPWFWYSVVQAHRTILKVASPFLFHGIVWEVSASILL